MPSPAAALPLAHLVARFLSVLPGFVRPYMSPIPQVKLQFFHLSRQTSQRRFHMLDCLGFLVISSKKKKKKNNLNNLINNRNLPHY